ncbi:archaeosortase/exosortase family protein [bacterium]|nr:archaeosortase/exosortase family protein [bacterium]
MEQPFQPYLNIFIIFQEINLGCKKTRKKKTQKKVLKFVLLVVLFAALEYLFLYFILPDKVNFLIQSGTARVVFWIISLLGIEAAIFGDVINLGTISLQIVYECTGGFAFFIYSSCVLAYPSKWKEKLLGHLIGLISIFLMNIIRLVLIAWVGIKSKPAFDFIHNYLWQGTFIVFVILIWIIWVDKIVKSK